MTELEEKLINKIDKVDNKLDNEIILDGLIKSGIKNEKIENLRKKLNSINNKNIEILSKKELDDISHKLELIDICTTSVTGIIKHKIDILNNINFLIKHIPILNKNEDVFNENYQKLIELLHTQELESNLTLYTKSRNLPFALFKNNNGSIIVTSGDEKTPMPISKDRLFEVAFKNKEPAYKSYEPIIIEKLLDNTIFNEIRESDLVEKTIKSNKDYQQFEQLNNERLKLAGKVSELESKLDERTVLFENMTNIYENASNIESDYKNAKEAVLKELKSQHSQTYWEEQISKYTTRYRIYFGIVIGLVLILLISLYTVDINFAELEITQKTISDVNTSKSSKLIQENIPKIDFIKYGFMILCISLGIWIIRIFMKIALSSYHLSIDANERVVMIKTYLSLIKETGNVNDTDKKVMLDNIFRPTNHGIIKDENSVTITDVIQSFKK